uniref:Aa_trans domain-containing protein n=1 Tax=Angiostrongylus cantonensis TaxID=6313 RepID=A0A0K0DHR4_ANGCA
MGASLIWLLPAVRETNNQMVFLVAICAMFTCIGGTYSLFPYITNKHFGSTNFGVIYGFIQCSMVRIDTIDMQHYRENIDDVIAYAEVQLKLNQCQGLNIKKFSQSSHH